jgi:hypothetical protein
MTITKEIKEALRNVYSPLKRAYELKGTVFSSEFDRAKELANKRLDTLFHDMSDSAFGLWKLGLLPEEELNNIRNCADKLHNFVVVSVEHFRNLEKEAYGETAYYSREYDYIRATQGFNYSEAEFIELFGTKEAYVENSITDLFDDIDITLEDMLSYFNMVK